MNKKETTGTMEQILIWLSASDPDVLKNKCPRWEKIKYEAFGASVLVPVFFGMIASSYAISTLTSNWFIIGMFSLVWGFIILTIDRVLLSTYRAFVSKSKKWIQFSLRISVAILMGLTVSHPLTLLLFKDTINSEIEKERTSEMLAARQVTDSEKGTMDARIKAASESLASHQQKYQETVSGDFLNAAPAPVVQRAPETDARFADIDAQIDNYKDERDQVRNDLEKWQTTYDAEVRGVRSGKSGIGPNARAIERDHLSWRQDEIQRLNGVIGELTSRRSKLSSEIMTRTMEVSASLESSRRDLEKQKLSMFASQQGQLLEVIKGQIDSSSAELAQLRSEASQLATDTSDRVASLKVEKRADLMAQTNTLHKMFKSPEAGGTFALVVYIILVLLFTMIDTIPLVVKFCSVPGLYDLYLYDKEFVVRPISPTAETEIINDNFSLYMKNRGDILHGLMHYNPGTGGDGKLQNPLAQLSATRGLETASTLPAWAETAIADDDELIVPLNEKGIDEIEGTEIFAPHVAPRAIKGQLSLAEVELNSEVKPKNGHSHKNEAINDFPIEPTPENDFATEINLPSTEAPIVNEVPTPDEVELSEVEEVGSESPELPAYEEEFLDASNGLLDEPGMEDPGFGALILNGKSENVDYSAEIEIPVKKAEDSRRSYPVKSIRHHLDEQPANPGIDLPKGSEGNTRNDEDAVPQQKKPDYSPSNFRNNWAAQKAAGGLALKPINGNGDSSH